MFPTEDRVRLLLLFLAVTMLSVLAIDHVTNSEASMEPAWRSGLMLQELQTRSGTYYYYD